MRRAAVVLAAAFFAPLCIGQKAGPPPLPCFDWNACPFEGCEYGEWTAGTPSIVYDTWKGSRRPIARLAPGDKVTGLAGVVITFKPGVIQMYSALESDGLEPGDVVLTYTPRGEGSFAVWFKGRHYPSFDVSFAKRRDESDCMGDCLGAFLDVGKQAWWAKVKLKSGRKGWIDMDAANFSGMDVLAEAGAGAGYSGRNIPIHHAGKAVRP